MATRTWSGRWRPKRCIYRWEWWWSAMVMKCNALLYKKSELYDLQNMIIALSGVKRYEDDDDSRRVCARTRRKSTPITSTRAPCTTPSRASTCRIHCATFVTFYTIRWRSAATRRSSPGFCQPRDSHRTRSDRREESLRKITNNWVGESEALFFYAL